jgi:hypothetical protein
MWELILPLLKAIPVIGGIFKMLFPSPEERLGKSEQAMQDLAANTKAEKIKDSTLVSNNVDKDLEDGTF